MPSFQHFSSTIHYREDGQGIPVVALHSSASSSKQWDSLTGYLSGRFRVICPDLPGYGKSDALDGSPRLADIVDVLSSLFRKLDQPAHLVGHSFGGAVALKAAQMLPDKILSLTVIEPASFHLLRDDRIAAPYLTEIEAVEQSMAGHITAGDQSEAMACFIDFWNGEGAWGRTSAGLRQKLAILSSQVMSDFQAIFAEDTGLADLASVTCPVLVMAGEHSPNLTSHLAMRIAETLRFARFTEIIDAGHMAPLTDPHEVDPMIAAHLLSIDRRANRCTTLASAAA